MIFGLVGRGALALHRTEGMHSITMDGWTDGWTVVVHCRHARSDGGIIPFSNSAKGLSRGPSKQAWKSE